MASKATACSDQWPTSSVKQTRHFKVLGVDRSDTVQDWRAPEIQEPKLRAKINIPGRPHRVVPRLARNDEIILSGRSPKLDTAVGYKHQSAP